MQLILLSETELGVHGKMSALDEESLDEKLVYDDINDIKNGEITTVNKELIFDCLDEKLSSNENDCHNIDNQSSSNTENNKCNNTSVESKENINSSLDSIDNTQYEKTTNSNLSQDIKYNETSCENNDQSFESQKSIIDDENMDLVLQKEAEILDDQECVEDLISLAKEISESNEKINVDLSIGERSELDITNNDILTEETTASGQIQINKENTEVLKEILLEKIALDESTDTRTTMIETTEIISEKDENNTKHREEQISNGNENMDKMQPESNNLNSQSMECEKLNHNNVNMQCVVEQENTFPEKDLCNRNVTDNSNDDLLQTQTETEKDNDNKITEDENKEKIVLESNALDIIENTEETQENQMSNGLQESNEISDEGNVEMESTIMVSKDVQDISPTDEIVISAHETIPRNIEEISKEEAGNRTIETVNENSPEKQFNDTEDISNNPNNKNNESSEMIALNSNDDTIEPSTFAVLSPKENILENKTRKINIIGQDGKLMEDTMDSIITCESDEKDTELNDKALSKQNTFTAEENISIQIETEKQEETEEGKDANLSDNNIDEPMELDTTVSSDTVILKSPTCTEQPVRKLCSLSNNLDILSDDDDSDHNHKETTSSSLIPIEKKICTDEDDIMIIDEDTNVKSTKKDTNELETDDEKLKIETKVNEIPLGSPENINDLIKEKTENKTSCDEKEAEAPSVMDTSVPEISEKSLEYENEKSKSQKPLLSENFLSTCKKNFAHMTRDDLEEFCILKIVESVVDRSSLNEIKSKIKTMSQNLEEYKKKAMTLTKQNRDLQVVLKSVQEEQKKRSGGPITPLKITRSVGMQILMTEPSRRKGTGGIMIPVNVSNGNLISSNINNNNTNTRQLRNTNNQNQRTLKTNNVQQIPVPRLVPASNNLVTKAPSAPNTNSGKTNSPSPIPNGIKNPPPTQKPTEKRAHSRISQSPSSVTVDLTDDEPPLKVTARSPTVAPVRLVSPQTLMAPQRPQFGQQVNSPRKVYIPISGPQAPNVRPGQSIVLKSLPPQGPRPRGPGPGAVVRPPQSLRRVQGVRHPAPLPDAMKQYQPPNWKALPPAPDLKLSKVENGIVISWKIEGYQEDSYEEIASYQLYAYQETSSPPSTALWKKIGDVKALPLPMACTLTQFMAGYKYYFAVRAVDVRSRVGPFSLPGSILLLSKT